MWGERTAKKSCMCGECGSFEHLLLFSLLNSFSPSEMSLYIFSLCQISLAYYVLCCHVVQLLSIHACVFSWRCGNGCSYQHVWDSHYHDRLPGHYAAQGRSSVEIVSKDRTGIPSRWDRKWSYCDRCGVHIPIVSYQLYQMSSIWGSVVVQVSVQCDWVRDWVWF